MLINVEIEMQMEKIGEVAGWGEGDSHSPPG